MQNDLAEVLLGLFVPWNQLTALSRLHAVGCGKTRDAYAKDLEYRGANTFSA
jgi:hypothetical protein